MHKKKLILAILVSITVLACTMTAASQPIATSIETISVPPSPTVPPAPTEAQLVPVTVYFTDENRYAIGTEPYEVAVARTVPADANLPEAVLEQFFLGPTTEEYALGLRAITSGFTGFRDLTIENGIAYVYLEGPCASNGAVYTIAGPIFLNLRQFPDIQFIKIFDATGGTEQPSGFSDSIPFCLEP